MNIQNNIKQPEIQDKAQLNSPEESDDELLFEEDVYLNGNLKTK